jgi:hypothetical protein
VDESRSLPPDLARDDPTSREDIPERRSEPRALVVAERFPMNSMSIQAMLDPSPKIFLVPTVRLLERDQSELDAAV